MGTEEGRKPDRKGCPSRHKVSESKTILAGGTTDTGRGGPEVGGWRWVHTIYELTETSPFRFDSLVRSVLSNKGK